VPTERTEDTEIGRNCCPRTNANLRGPGFVTIRVIRGRKCWVPGFKFRATRQCAQKLTRDLPSTRACQPVFFSNRRHASLATQKPAPRASRWRRSSPSWSSSSAGRRWGGSSTSGALIMTPASIQLQFLRRTPWARAKVEALYLTRVAPAQPEGSAAPPDPREMQLRLPPLGRSGFTPDMQETRRG